MDDFTGKVALVTGGSRGIGRGIALKLAQAGCDIVINYLERHDAAHEVGEWITGMGRKVLVTRADVTDENHVADLFGQTQAVFGKLDILVNNVGPFTPRRLLKTGTGEWHLMINGNLTSAFYCARQAADLMLKRESGGSMVFIGAPNAERVGSQSESPAYSIAKTGVVILALSLARDLAPKGIRVNVLNPGYIENDSMTPRQREWMPNEVPLGRVGTPAEVGDGVLFLCSDQARYVTGTILNVHGGLWV